MAGSLPTQMKDLPNSDQTHSWSVIDRMAKKFVTHRLSRLRAGQVILVDAESTQSLGEPGSWGASELRVNDIRFYRMAVLGGAIGFAEAYLEGMWETDDLTSLLQIFVRNIEVAHTHQRGAARLAEPIRLMGHRLRQNSKLGSKKNIAAHYDLGNEFFALFLDETMTYSCGVFESANSSLHDASIAKLDRICQKLNLSSDDHVLEIGTGWGSFAVHAAREYGCKVTTTTISKRQHELACQRVRQAGLEDRVTLLLKDYRDLEGEFDKLVSIEMIEAVGNKYLDQYFASCSRLLKSDGEMLLQAITMPDSRYREYLRTVDFIQRYVFPGSCCPSPGAMARSISRSSNLRLTHLEDLTPHYVTTLAHWREQFHQQIEAVRELGYTERFERMWNYYLCYCEAGFAERYIGTVQMKLSKPGSRAHPITPNFD
jgi:cyclopropane-fatty-acyl-phospholipid synthase